MIKIPLEVRKSSLSKSTITTVNASTPAVTAAINNVSISSTSTVSTNTHSTKISSHSNNLKKQVIIKDKWKLINKLGQGSFGFVVSAVDIRNNDRKAAIKFERTTVRKSVLKLEIVILRQMQFSNHVCRYFGCGRCPLDIPLSKQQAPSPSTSTSPQLPVQNEYSFLIMELLGPSLGVLLKKRRDERFSMATTALLGKQMLKAIEDLHDIGYIHRDIKPSNFAIGLQANEHTNRSVCYLIDYGLCRRYISSHGSLRPARSKVGFRGTARYASITAHQSRDLSRRDDLLSLFYVISEFMLGTLPWKGIKDKDEIGRMKMESTERVVEQLPLPLRNFYEHIIKLRFVDTPKYKRLYRYFDDLFELSGQPMDIPYDWDIMDDLVSAETSVLTMSHARNATTREPYDNNQSMTSIISQPSKMNNNDEDLCMLTQKQTQQHGNPTSIMSIDKTHRDTTKAMENNEQDETIDMNDTEHQTKMLSPQPPRERLRSPRKQFSTRLRRLGLAADSPS